MRTRRVTLTVSVAVVVTVLIAGWVSQQLRVESRDQPVTDADLRILQRADALLASPDAWNRRDDRRCDDDEAAGKRSLFCALQKAETDVRGAYVHRSVALQEVRFAIQDATEHRRAEMTWNSLKHFSLPHRLMDYNNLPDTRLEDIHAILRVAMNHVASRLQTQLR